MTTDERFLRLENAMTTLAELSAQHDARLSTLAQLSAQHDARLSTMERSLQTLERSFQTLVQLSVSASERADQHQTWINQLGKRMEEIAAAQANADEKIAALADAQIRTEESLKQLADAQRKGWNGRSES